MKLIVNIFFAAVLLNAPLDLSAQKDSMLLACPFLHGSGKEPKEAYTWYPKDLKIIMTSHVDTIVRSCLTGTISNVNTTEDNNYEVVIYYKNFYFWYYGVAKPLVKVGQNVMAGQTIGTYRFGVELEFRMFKGEVPIDPRNLLECKVPKADD